jgi:hypothetical protein
MKCPFCNYVSFDYLNTCRKCSKDLSAHRAKYDINFLEPISLGILSFAAMTASAPAAAGAASFSHEDLHSPSDEAEEPHTVSSVEEAMGVAANGGDDSFGFTLDDSTGDFSMPDASEGDIEIPEKSGAGTAVAGAAAASSGPDEISFDSDEISLGGEEETTVPATAAMEPEHEEIAMDISPEEAPSLEVSMETPDEITLEEQVAHVAQAAPDISMEEPEPSGEINFDEPAAEPAPDISMEEPDLAGGDSALSSDSGFSLGLGEDMGGLDSELDFSSIGGDSGGGAATPSSGGGSEFEDVNLSDDDIFGSGGGKKDDDLDLELDKA